MCLLLFVGFLFWILFWYAFLYVLSSFAITLTRKRELVALLLLSFRMSCLYQWSLSFPYSAVGWSAVCDSGIS